MRKLILLVGVLWLAACVPPLASQRSASQPNTPASPDDSQPRPTPTLVRAVLEDLGPAPELTNEVWLNSDQPLRLADLNGQVVLLDMWTFG